MTDIVIQKGRSVEETGNKNHFKYKNFKIETMHARYRTIKGITYSCYIDIHKAIKIKGALYSTGLLISSCNIKLPSKIHNAGPVILRLLHEYMEKNGFRNLIQKVKSIKNKNLEIEDERILRIVFDGGDHV